MAGGLLLHKIVHVFDSPPLYALKRTPSLFFSCIYPLFGTLGQSKLAMSVVFLLPTSNRCPLSLSVTAVFFPLALGPSALFLR